MFPSIGSYTSSYLLGFAAGVCFLRGVQLMLYSKRRRALSKGINRAVRTQIQQELQPGGLLYRAGGTKLHLAERKAAFYSSDKKP